MANLPRTYFILAVLLLVFGLTGCALPRNNNENADLEPVEALPPTLAPLSAESSELPATNATPIPTIINVQPTATTSPLGAGEAAPSPNETVAPTAAPPSVPETPVVSNSQVQQTATTSETFVAPTEEAIVTDEPVVVDATSSEASTSAPAAANPPVNSVSNENITPGQGESAYTVQPGDTLFSIGARYGTTAEAIMASNGLTSDLVYAGQVLVIPAGDIIDYPAPAAGSAPMANPGVHTVARGETLYSIAVNYGTTVEAIAMVNRIPYPFVIFEGQPLTIPTGENSYPVPQPDYYPANPAPEGNYVPAQPYSPQGPVPGNTAGGTHTVVPGETLYSIARRYGTTPEALIMANGLMNPDQIYVGQVLYLP